MRYLIVLSALCGCTDVMVPTGGTPVPEPAIADSLWATMRDCYPVPPIDIHTIQWIDMGRGGMDCAHATAAGGCWVAPNRIYLSLPPWADSVGVIRHELAHARIQDGRHTDAFMACATVR